MNARRERKEEEEEEEEEEDHLFFFFFLSSFLLPQVSILVTSNDSGFTYHRSIIRNSQTETNIQTNTCF